MSAATRALHRGLFFLGVAVVFATPLGHVAGNGVMFLVSLTGYTPLGTI